MCSFQGYVTASLNLHGFAQLEQVELGWAKGLAKSRWRALAKVDPAEKLQNCNSADSSGDVAKLRVPTLQFCKTRRRKIAFLLNKLKISLKTKDFLMKGHLILAKIINFKQ